MVDKRDLIATLEQALPRALSKAVSCLPRFFHVDRNDVSRANSTSGHGGCPSLSNGLCG